MKVKMKIIIKNCTDKKSGKKKAFTSISSTELNGCNQSFFRLKRTLDEVACRSIPDSPTTTRTEIEVRMVGKGFLDQGLPKCI